MRRPIFLMLFAVGALHLDSFAQRLPAVTQLQVQAHPDVADLVCEKKPPAVRPPREPNPDPLEVPTLDLVDTLQPGELPASIAPHVPSPWSAAHPIPSKDGFRIAIWGDSHLAANFFSEELAKLLKVPADSVSNGLIPANMGRAGVRLPLRQSCVSPQWKYELAYVGGENAAAPGPGMVNMVSEQPGATLAWDLRKDAQSPGYERVRILYQQLDTPMVVGVSVDGEAEKEVTLGAQAGPAALELVAQQPMAQVKLRVIDGRFRFHGLDLASARANPFVFDVFGYPGATVASWKNASPGYLGAWLAQRDYQLVMLEFGTNEGNVKPFDLAVYRKTLADSVRNMKDMFPAASCILIGPGDRGVLVPRSANLRTKAESARGKKKGKAAQAAKRKKPAAPPIDLFVYSRIHAQINRVQAEVAQEAGCIAWSMQDAMGGQGSAYSWAQQSPALMAKDLIHFTAAGYRRLAQEFAHDMGWTETAAAKPAPAAPVR